MTVMRYASHIAPALLIAASFVWGLFFNGAHDVQYAPSLLCLLAGLVVAALPGAWRDLKIPKDASALFLLALWLYITISLMWSETPFPSLVTYMVFCILPLTFFGLLLSPSRREVINVTGILLLAALGLLGLCAIGEVTIYRSIYGPRAAWPMLDANNLAALMNMGLMPALALFIATENRTAKIAAGLTSLLLFGGLLSTASRGGMICAILGAAALLWILKPSLKDQKKPLIALAVLALAAFGALNIQGDGAGARLASLPHVFSDIDAMNRPILWKATLHMIAEKPLTGTGLGSFYLTYAAHRPIADTRSAGQWVHNDPLQYAAEMGILAPLLLYAFLGALLRRAAITLPTDTQERAVAAGTMCGFFAMILHAHVNFQLYIIPILIVSGVWLAAWYDRIEADWFTPSPTRGQRAIYAVLVLSIAGLIAVPVVRCGGATWYLLKGVNELKRGHLQNFVALMNKSDDFGPATFIDARVQRAQFYIDLLSTKNGILTKQDRRAMALDVMQTLDIAERTAPPWPEVNNKRADLYLAMKDEFDPDWEMNVENEWRAALAKDPLNIKARSKLINAMMAKGDVDTAYRLLIEGLQRPHPVGDQDAMLTMKANMETLLRVKRHYMENKKP